MKQNLSLEETEATPFEVTKRKLTTGVGESDSKRALVKSQAPTRKEVV